MMGIFPFCEPNAAVSRNLCAVCLVVQWNDSDTTRQTARKLSACTALLASLVFKSRTYHVATVLTAKKSF